MFDVGHPLVLGVLRRFDRIEIAIAHQASSP
jgi:hypothetical protein